MAGDLGHDEARDRGAGAAVQRVERPGGDLGQGLRLEPHHRLNLLGPLAGEGLVVELGHPPSVRGQPVNLALASVGGIGGVAPGGQNQSLVVVRALVDGGRCQIGRELGRERLRGLAVRRAYRAQQGAEERACAVRV